MDILDAPLYPSAAAFELPVAISFRPRLADMWLSDLMKIPEAWALILQRFPVMATVVESPLAKPNLHQITLYLVNHFKPFATPEELATLDADLQKLPSFVVVAP